MKKSLLEMGYSVGKYCNLQTRQNGGEAKKGVRSGFQKGSQ